MEPFSTQYVLSSKSRASKATRFQLYWVAFLICSLAYELPLAALTSMDRVNPRLFDIATIVGLVFVWPKVRSSAALPKPYYYWASIVLWFFICALVWVAWLPFEKWLFSIFFSIKYLQGLFVIYLALKIPLAPEQKKILHYTVIACGVFLAIYCIPEFIGGGTTIRHLSGGKDVHLAPGTLLGPLGSTYSHLASWSALSFALALSLFGSKGRMQKPWLVFLIAFFVAWPGMASGSRAGLFSILIILFLSIYYLPRLRSRFLMVATVSLLAVGGLSFQLPTVEELRGYSRSLDRLIGTEEKGAGNTIGGRLGVASGSSYSLDQYEWQGLLLPIVGGGFYVVPHSRNGILTYRVGYGIHNGYLFPFEQGGIVAFFLFLVFLGSSSKKLRIMRKSQNMIDANFALGVWVFFLVMLLSSWVGNPFWLGSGMENFSTLAVLIILLGCKATSQYNQQIE